VYENFCTGGWLMRKSNRRFLLSVVGGIVLITAGVIFLLSNIGVFRLNLEMLVGPLMALGGLVFLVVFITNTDEWWALIPGFVLIGIGINTFMGQWMGTGDGRISSAIFLGFVGLPFFLIYIFHKQHWWAIIPGGVLFTLAVISLIEGKVALEGGLFFLGLALTFGLVYILPKPAGKLKWALYPAGVLLLLSVIVLLGVTDISGYIWPLALFIGGGYVLYRAIRK
jgi:hypothetical protein